MKQLKMAELKQASQQEVIQKLIEMRQEYLKLRLNAATSHVKSFPSQKRALRKNIARLLTSLRQSIEEIK